VCVRRARLLMVSPDSRVNLARRQAETPLSDLFRFAGPALMPPVYRGVGTCQTCHTPANYTLFEGASYRSIPGHSRWNMAPITMAWQGKSLTQLCQQLKDPERNGGRNLEFLYEHLAHDDLVAWGWQPGEGRRPAPGSQKELGELVRAWIDTGAICP